jgi:hypothetical protein
MKQHLWKDDAKCLDLDTNLFFEKYEDNPELRPNVDSLCLMCPVVKQCFAVGISGKEWGVWGGIYIEHGDISREINKHKTKQDWANIWKTLTLEK